MNASDSSLLMVGSAPGRRERKKAVTRASIAQAALDLFLQRGFDDVSIRDIAERADVAVATIFAHFSGKEALVFDEDDVVAHSLIAAVEQRTAGVDVLGALEAWSLASRAADHARESNPEFASFRRLIVATPALQQYWKSMWRGYEAGLAEGIIGSSDAGPRVAHLIATLTIEGYLLAADDERPDQALRLLFEVLRNGFPAVD